MRTKWINIAVGVAALAMPTATLAAELDFGQVMEKAKSDLSQGLFGFGTPLASSATEGVDRAIGQPASDRQFLAAGLQAEFVTRAIGGNGDMIAFWPNDINYTHLIVCNELGRYGTTPGGGDGYNPGVQRVDVKTGQVETILHGMSRCDGIRTTQWGTILATEENGADGGAYEIIDPLGTTAHWIADRGAQGAAADIRDGIDSANPSTKVVKRTTLAAQSWEGLEVLDNGIVIGGDELRPSRDSDGGAIFRFVPTTPYACANAPVRPGLLCSNTISSLDESPFVDGTNYALSTVCTGTSNFGQGCEAGRGYWVEVNAGTARTDAAERGATGYCRPEDLHVDRSFGAFDGGEGIRWCWNNTCGAGIGETLCVVEDANWRASASVFSNDFSQPLLSADGVSPWRVQVTRFNTGDSQLNSHDNLDIQPHTSNVYIIEDNRFGDVWACLQDGADIDQNTDGCVRVLSVRDASAEPTGFIFDGTGEVAYYIVQHGQQIDELRDFASNPIDGRTDDLIRITGFKVEGVPMTINTPNGTVRPRSFGAR